MPGYEGSSDKKRMVSINVGEVLPTAPLRPGAIAKQWLLRSKGPNPKRFILRECKEEMSSDQDPPITGKAGQPGSNYHGGDKWSGKERPLATMAKARAMHHSAPDTVKVANAMKKPLDPRPRPRGETYQSCMEPRAPSPNSMEVEYYWNRTPVITPKPKPAPPKLSDLCG